MSKLEMAGKGTLFATAISVITAGIQLLNGNFNAGLTCLVAGVALIVIWAVLIDWEARREAVKAANKMFKKFVLEGREHE